MSFTTETRTNLRGLAEGLLPLQEWVESAAHAYTPPGPASLPWRHGEPLSHERLQTIEYVEWAIAASDADDLLLARWDRIRQEPLAFCPLPSPRDFREGRGLSLAPRFATVEAGNSLADASGRQMSRRQLYDQCTPILALTITDARRRLGDNTPQFWSVLAQELHRGNCPEWRGVAGAPQSTLLTEQFLRDALTALLNGWLDVPPPWRYAVLIELGEFRRPGNAFTRADVENARAALQAALGGTSTPAAPSSESHTDVAKYATQWKSIP